MTADDNAAAAAKMEMLAAKAAALALSDAAAAKAEKEAKAKAAAERKRAKEAQDQKAHYSGGKFGKVKAKATKGRRKMAIKKVVVLKKKPAVMGKKK